MHAGIKLNHASKGGPWSKREPYTREAADSCQSLI